MKKKTNKRLDKSKHTYHTVGSTADQILKLIRKNRYISQTKMADIIGVSKQAVSQNIRRHNIQREL